MPVRVDKILSAGLYTVDGEKVLDFTDTCCDEYSEILSIEDTPSYIRIDVPEEFSFNIEMRFKDRKNLEKIIYGWIAKGPIRKKVLEGLWKKYHSSLYKEK